MNVGSEPVAFSRRTRSAAAPDDTSYPSSQSRALTAGASAPECLVEEVLHFLRDAGFTNLQELEVMPENVRFGLPPEIVEAIGAAPQAAIAQ